MARRKKVRILRHWKQQWDPNAAFIWRRDTPYAGKTRKAGTRVIKDLIPSAHKLRMLWESGRIELAEFEEPKNVTTGKGDPLRPSYETPMNAEEYALFRRGIARGADMETAKWEARNPGKTRKKPAPEKPKAPDPDKAPASEKPGPNKATPSKKRSSRRKSVTPKPPAEKPVTTSGIQPPTQEEADALRAKAEADAALSSI